MKNRPDGQRQWIGFVGVTGGVLVLAAVGKLVYTQLTGQLLTVGDGEAIVLAVIVGGAMMAIGLLGLLR